MVVDDARFEYWYVIGIQYMKLHQDVRIIMLDVNIIPYNEFS